MKKYPIIAILFISLGIFSGLLVYYFCNPLIINKFVQSSEQKPEHNITEYILDLESDVKSEEEFITIAFIGDIMVDRYIRKIANRNSYEYLFDKVREKLSEATLVVANLEGPVTDFLSIANSEVEHERFVFTFDPLIIKALENANIKIVNIDNNHITNFGNEGLKQTVKYLESSSVNYFGNPYNRNILFKKFDQITIAFVSYNQFINPDTIETNKLIVSANELADHVVVYTHWGDEYELRPNQNQISLAHEFIDNGADLIIGSHPHVVQTKEIYKNRQIYYSLGNFIFDQYFTEEVSCGAVVTFEFNKKEIKLLSEEFVKLDPANVVSFLDCRQEIH